MNVLIACEESQIECKAFRELGHNAYSCDIQEPSGGHKEWHIHGNVLNCINGNTYFKTMDGKLHYLPKQWDLIIAHPPCTYLTNAGNKYRDYPGRHDKCLKAFEFAMQILDADCERIALENPPGYLNSHYRAADQTIHPYYFSVSCVDINYQLKRTCLWLKGLPPLYYNVVVPKPEPCYYTLCKDGTLKARYRTESLHGSKERSKSFPGVASAMANQCGRLISNDGILIY